MGVKYLRVATHVHFLLFDELNMQILHAVKHFIKTFPVFWC